MKILNFGSCNIDYVYEVENIVRGGETISSNNLKIFAGGKGLNQTIAVARSGNEIYHAGCIGKDGLFLKNMLDDEKVNTKYLKISENQTGHAIIQVDKKGENSIILYKGTNHLIDKAHIDLVLNDFTDGDILILQNEISNLNYIVDKAHERQIKIALNPSPIDQNILDLDFTKINFLILNEREAIEISKTVNLDSACDFFTTNYPKLNVIITLGKNGSVFLNGKENYACNAFSANAVDTTGAGDTFLGYFVSNLANTGDVVASLNIASMAAAISVTKNGAAQSIPYKEQVISSLEKIK